MYIEQGQMIALVGPAEQGKSTVLKIIGSVVLPKPGGFFVPAHLRALHVSNEPLFFLGSLFDNLAFGVLEGDADRDSSRVTQISEGLSMSAKTLEFIRQGPNGEARIWLEVLSHTQKSLCMVARALIANPELMCIHKPTMAFNEKVTTNVLTLLREFVDNKGAAQNKATRHQRRPRTLLMTSSKFLGVDVADKVFCVTRADGIQEIDKSRVSEELLS
eukprot:gnl/TRDRNA2_/TRDRNA2_173788_c2_seq1.p1 gnl/TRDRNA2_/TRDRNA2_173788_c2~~gnl/TRDRNA2_/TRDRNA2_173788_c2_seq1.p1  ORF type:complete len:232 (-),score=30.50 gnl/TRDRNA2_/TRDRNA2_173788_c2_seq1:62-712(-)